MKKIKKHFLRSLSMLVLPIGVVLAIASPVGAVSTLSILSPGTLVGRGEAVRVSIKVACDAGETAFLDARVTQRSGGQIASGFGSVSPITCTGSSQTLSVFVTTSTNKAFHKGQAVAQANLTACSSITCATINTEEVIKLK